MEKELGDLVKRIVEIVIFYCVLLIVYKVVELLLFTFPRLGLRIFVYGTAFAFLTCQTIQGQLASILIPVVSIMFNLGLGFAQNSGGIDTDRAEAKEATPLRWSTGIVAYAFPLAFLLLRIVFGLKPEAITQGAGVLLAITGMAYDMYSLRIKDTKPVPDTKPTLPAPAHNTDPEFSDDRLNCPDLPGRLIQWEAARSICERKRLTAEYLQSRYNDSGILLTWTYNQIHADLQAKLALFTIHPELAAEVAATSCPGPDNISPIIDFSNDSEAA